MHKAKHQAANMPALVGQLQDVQSSLSSDEQDVFAEMIGLAANKAQELSEQLAGEVMGGVSVRDLVYDKPISSVASFDDLRTINRLGSLFGRSAVVNPSLGGLRIDAVLTRLG
jgi:hypothetical protein